MENLKEQKVVFNPIVFVRIITENVRKDLSYNDPVAKLAVSPTKSALKRGCLVNRRVGLEGRVVNVLRMIHHKFWVL